ncbi:alpha/beta hydrolase family protein [Leptospira bouyouniensis]|uniref:alpha/beta hydrolase family protein n=1 Tax=Leptospira bouyouniensis TaxID=2484911 RepID=UPI001FEFF734|nr:alpha/beta hydrolase [Leptospira bouyouniensis]
MPIEKFDYLKMITSNLVRLFVNLFPVYLCLVFFCECSSVQRGRFFDNQAFHFQTLRAINDVKANGAETGEILETIKHIKEGDTESWRFAWERIGNAVLKKAETYSDPKSKGNALLRAHNYLRTAEFFMDPTDPNRESVYKKSTDAFYNGLNALGVQYEHIKVPYGKHYLNANYFPGPAGSENKPLIVFVGGFDSVLEELYFVIVHNAYERGYSVLTYEGPGQGEVIRKQNLPFTYEWEKPNKAVMDTFLKNHKKHDKIILVGMSFGGYLGPRAAAFDDRFDGIVAFDVGYDFGAVAENATPGIAIWLQKHEFHRTVEFLSSIKSKFSSTFSWGLKNARWTFNTKDSNETLIAFRKFTLEGVADKIKQDVLILAGTKDHFIPLNQVEKFQKNLKNAKSVQTIIYDEEFGGAEHCQLGAATLWQADFFEWIKKFEPNNTNVKK